MAILLADDDTIMLTLTSAFLTRSGYEVRHAINAAQVIDALDTMSPDMIILDVMMPGTTGIELCRRLRDRDGTQSTPIILMSALTDPDTLYQSMDAGASAFVCKSELMRLPVVVRELLAALPN